MRVPGIIYASDKLMKVMGKDESPKQVANVAQLPGIVKYSLAMPDMHWGYGFPIGGVAAFDMRRRASSRRAVWVTTSTAAAVSWRQTCAGKRSGRRWRRLVNALFQHVPSGVGSRGDLKLSRKRREAGPCRGGPVGREKRLRLPGRPGVHGGRGVSGRGRPGGGERKGPREGEGPGGHPGLRQSFPRGGDRRGDLRRGLRPRPWGSKSARWPS